MSVGGVHFLCIIIICMYVCSINTTNVYVFNGCRDIHTYTDGVRYHTHVHYRALYSGYPPTKFFLGKKKNTKSLVIVNTEPGNWTII